MREELWQVVIVDLFGEAVFLREVSNHGDS